MLFYYLFILVVYSISAIHFTNGWDIPSSNQYHIQTDEGPERYFRYQTDSGQYRKEKRLEDGTVVGTYAWIDDNGFLRQRDYIADNDGYRILKTKNVFVGRNMPVGEAIKAIKKYPASAGTLVNSNQRPAVPVPYKTAVPSASYIPNAIPSVSYLPSSVPSATYLPSSPPSSKYLPSSAPSSTYLPSSTPAFTYLPSSVHSTTPSPIVSSTGALYVDILPNSIVSTTPSGVLTTTESPVVEITPNSIHSTTISPLLLPPINSTPKISNSVSSIPTEYSSQPPIYYQSTTPSPPAKYLPPAPALQYLPSTQRPYESLIYNNAAPTELNQNALEYNPHVSQADNSYRFQNGPTYPLDQNGKSYVGQNIGNGYDPQYPSYDGVSVTNDGFRYYIPRAYHEEETLPGDKRSGSFGYIDPFGIRRVIYYNTAPGTGFQHKKNNRYVGLNATPYDPRPQ